MEGKWLTKWHPTTAQMSLEMHLVVPGCLKIPLGRTATQTFLSWQSFDCRDACRRLSMIVARWSCRMLGMLVECLFVDLLAWLPWPIPGSSALRLATSTFTTSSFVFLLSSPSFLFSPSNEHKRRVPLSLSISCLRSRSPASSVSSSHSLVPCLGLSLDRLCTLKLIFLVNT